MGLALSGQWNLGASGASGTAQFDSPSLTTSFGSLDLDVWVIDSTHLKFIETDTKSGPFLLAMRSRK